MNSEFAETYKAKASQDISIGTILANDPVIRGAPIGDILILSPEEVISYKRVFIALRDIRKGEIIEIPPSGFNNDVLVMGGITNGFVPCSF